MSDQKVNRFSQLKGSVLAYSYDFTSFARAQGLTVETITASTDDSTVASVTDLSVTGDEWTGTISASNEGEANISVTCTFVSSAVKRIRKFQVNVTDPE